MILCMLSLKYAVYENIHWGGFAFIKNVSKGWKKSLQWVGQIVLLTCIFSETTLMLRNSEITRFEYVKSIAFKFCTRADL